MAARPPPEQPDDSASPASALTVGGPASPLTLLLAEHSRWWREGKPSRVEEMLARHPSLADDPEVLLQLADHKVESPEDVVKVGDEIEVRVLRVDAADRKIGLSRKRLGWSKEESEEADEKEAAQAANRPQRELRGGTGSGTGQLFNMPESGEAGGGDKK